MAKVILYLHYIIILEVKCRHLHYNSSFHLLIGSRVVLLDLRLLLASPKFHPPPSDADAGEFSSDSPIDSH